MPIMGQPRHHQVPEHSICSVDVSSCKAYLRLAWAQTYAVYVLYMVVLGQARWRQQTAQAQTEVDVMYALHERITVATS